MVITAPNLLSMARVLILPAQLYFAWTGRARCFVILLVVSLTTDALGGFLARRLKQESPLGAQLDSWGDFVTYLSLPVCAWWLWPETMKREAPFIIAAVSSYLLPILFGFYRYGRLTSHHTWAAKISAVLVGISVLALFVWDFPWPLRISAPIFVLAGMEDIVITALLRQWHPDVRSFRQARLIRNASPGREG